MEVYHQLLLVGDFLALLFGAGWGFGGVFFGLSIDMVGLSLGYSIIFGIIAINGALTPLLMNEPGKLATTGGLWFLAAMFVMLLGIIVCAIAGNLKVESGGDDATSRSKKGSFRSGSDSLHSGRRPFGSSEFCVYLRNGDHASSADIPAQILSRRSTRYGLLCSPLIILRMWATVFI